MSDSYHVLTSFAVHGDVPLFVVALFVRVKLRKVFALSVQYTNDYISLESYMNVCTMTVVDEVTVYHVFHKKPHAVFVRLVNIFYPRVF